MKKTLFGLTGLNIQLFASTMSAEARQDQYSTKAKIAYGLATTEEKNRLLSYVAKNSNKSHDRFAFYVTGRLTGKEQAEASINDDGTDVTVTQKKGVSIKNFVQSVWVTPTKSDCPIWRSKDDDLETTLDVKSGLINAQVSAVTAISIKKILTPLGTLAKLAKGATRKATLNTKTATKEVTLPDANQFGDKTKSFKENEEAFFEMLAEMETASVGNGLNSGIALLHGKSGNAVMKQYDRANNKEWIQSADFEMKDGKKLAIKKFDVAELVNLNSYDTHVGKQYIIGILEGAMGYDTKGEPETITSEDDAKENNYYNLIARDVASIVDIEGIFIFEFNGKYNTTGVVARTKKGE